MHVGIFFLNIFSCSNRRPDEDEALGFISTRPIFIIIARRWYTGIIYNNIVLLYHVGNEIEENDAEEGTGFLHAGVPEGHGDDATSVGRDARPPDRRRRGHRVRDQLQPARLPVDRGLRRGGRPPVPVARAVRDRRLRDVHAADGPRAARQAAAVRHVRRARAVGHGGPRPFGRRARAGRAAAHGDGTAAGPGRGATQLAGHGARAQDAADDGHRGRERSRGPRARAVLPAAAAARQRVPARPAAAGRDRHRRPGPDRHVQPGRPVRRHAGHVGAQRRPVRVPKHQVRDTHVREQGDRLPGRQERP